MAKTPCAICAKPTEGTYTDGGHKTAVCVKCFEAVYGSRDEEE